MVEGWIIGGWALPISNAGGQGKDGEASVVRGSGGDVTRRGCELEVGAGIADRECGVHPRVGTQRPERGWLGVRGT